MTRCTSYAKVMALLKGGLVLFFIVSNLHSKAQSEKAGQPSAKHHVYNVSVDGNDANDGSLSKPLRSIMAAANKAMPGDVITVHQGIYREQITPPRGGNSNDERIIYQAAKGEKVVIKGSEII